MGPDQTACSFQQGSSTPLHLSAAVTALILFEVLMQLTVSICKTAVVLFTAADCQAVCSHAVSSSHVVPALHPNPRTLCDSCTSLIDR